MCAETFCCRELLICSAAVVSFGCCSVLVCFTAKCWLSWNLTMCPFCDLFVVGKIGMRAALARMALSVAFLPFSLGQEICGHPFGGHVHENTSVDTDLLTAG